MSVRISGVLLYYYMWHIEFNGYKLYRVVKNGESECGEWLLNLACGESFWCYQNGKFKLLLELLQVILQYYWEGGLYRLVPEYTTLLSPQQQATTLHTKKNLGTVIEYY